MCCAADKLQHGSIHSWHTSLSQSADEVTWLSDDTHRAKPDNIWSGGSGSASELHCSDTQEMQQSPSRHSITIIKRSGQVVFLSKPQGPPLTPRSGEGAQRPVFALKVNIWRWGHIQKFTEWCNTECGKVVVAALGTWNHYPVYACMDWHKSGYNYLDFLFGTYDYMCMNLRSLFSDVKYYM